MHEFKALTVEEVMFIVERKWADFGCAFQKEDFADNESLATLVRMTHGNFRLIDRLLLQVQRILEVNNLSLITKEVIEAARQNLVIGVE
jgi:DNA transposition AAA+ family ATPase